MKQCTTVKSFCVGNYYVDEYDMLPTSAFGAGMRAEINRTCRGLIVSAVTDAVSPRCWHPRMYTAPNSGDCIDYGRTWSMYWMQVQCYPSLASWGRRPKNETRCGKGA